MSKTCDGDRNNGLKGEYYHAILPMREGKLSFSNLVHFPTTFAPQTKPLISLENIKHLMKFLPSSILINSTLKFFFISFLCSRLYNIF